MSIKQETKSYMNAIIDQYKNPRLTELVGALKIFFLNSSYGTWANKIQTVDVVCVMPQTLSFS